MTSFSDALSLASSGLRAQASRLQLVSENIANADTPGYRRKTAPFEMELREGQDVKTVALGRVDLDRTALDRIHDPAHPLADDAGYYDGSNVDLIIEIADAREAQRSYEANLKMFDQTRQMGQALWDLLRR